jgi:hypothetical protein
VRAGYPLLALKREPLAARREYDISGMRHGVLGVNIDGGKLAVSWR